MQTAIEAHKEIRSIVTVQAAGDTLQPFTGQVCSVKLSRCDTTAAADGEEIVPDNWGAPTQKWQCLGSGWIQLKWQINNLAAVFVTKRLPSWSHALQVPKLFHLQESLNGDPGTCSRHIFYRLSSAADNTCALLEPHMGRRKNELSTALDQPWKEQKHIILMECVVKKKWKAAAWRQRVKEFLFIKIKTQTSLQRASLYGLLLRVMTPRKCSEYISG